MYKHFGIIKQTMPIYNYIDHFEYLLLLAPKLPKSQALGYFFFLEGLKDEVNIVRAGPEIAITIRQIND